MSNDNTTGNDKTWVEKMRDRGAVKPYNDDNNKAQGKSLYEVKPASATTPNQEPPKPQPQKPSFSDRVKPNTPPIKPPQPPKPSGPKK